MTPSVADRPLGRLGRVVLILALIPCAILATADPITFLNFLMYCAVGVTLAIRRPRNRVSWIVIAIGIGFIPTTARPGIDGAALAAGTASTADFLNAWFGGWGGAASYLAYLALVLLFPTGRPPAGRWRRPTIAVLAVGVLAVALTAMAPTVSFNLDGGATSVIVPNRFAILPELGLWSLVPAEGGFLGVVVVLLAIGVVSMIVRYRRSSGVLRLQLRWLVAAFAFVIVALLLAFSILLILGPAAGGWVWIPAIVATPTIPIAIGVAITRYRLYEIDRIISRTIGWGLMTALLVGVFAVVVVALQAILADVTQGRTLAVAASTLAAFALFQPLRRQIQTLVDHRFDRARYDAQLLADGFAGQVRNEIDLATLRSALLATTGDAVRPAASDLWLRATRGGR